MKNIIILLSISVMFGFDGGAQNPTTTLVIMGAS